MSEHERTCAALVEKCKQEAKQLVEFDAAKKKLHWSHPSFISFCVSVEDVLCHGVKRRYSSSKTKVVSSSGKVLQDLGKNYPPAAEVFETCFNSTQDPSSREDYAVLHTNSLAERKVLWLRVALYEGKLHGIIEEILKNPRHYYTEQSVMCHPVYGEIFGYLLDGPCTLRFSRLKTSDILSPSPAEIVERHNKVISSAIFKSQQEGASVFATEEAWDHVRSLYQSRLSTCLFGKNNILMQPAGFLEPLDGYLSLQMGVTTLLLKWIPNCLLKDASNAEKSSLWEHVLSVDIVTIAHIHCHRSLGQSAELILIGYDGIAFPRIVFPHQPSLFHFLECLENSLLPRGCLEPPLWYLREQTIKNKKRRLSSSGEHGEGKGEEVEVEEEWWEGVEVWNQAFRVRAGSRRKEEEEDTVITAHVPPHLPLNLSLYPPSHPSNSNSESESGEEDSPVTVEKPGNLARKDWEKFQSKVLKQLLARYFYSWLSYCRHMGKVREEVAHMVKMDTVISPADSAHTYPQGLTEKMWREFLGSSDRADKWVEVLRAVYLKGMDGDLRAEVWPFLLGLYPINSTPEERAAIDQQSLEHYQRVLSEWKLVDEVKKKLDLQRLKRTSVLRNGPTINVSKEPSTNELKPQLPSTSESSPLSNTKGRKPPASSRSSSPSSLSDYSSRGVSPEPHEDAKQQTPVPTHNHTDLTETSTPSSKDCSAEVTLNGDSVSSNDAVVSSATNGPVQNGDTMEPTVSCEQVSNGSLDEEDLVSDLDRTSVAFLDELYTIDKDIPRCDRDYSYFKKISNLEKLRSVVSSYVWMHMKKGYSQGMCDLLAPLLVTLDDEALSYACYLRLMEGAQELFPLGSGMDTKLSNLRALLQILEPDFFQYLLDHPMGDSLSLYCYRWFLVSFKREFGYSDIFHLWESTWAARWCVSSHFEEFFALAIIQQFKTAIMDAHLDPSDILNLFTDLAEKKAIDCCMTIEIAQSNIAELQIALAKKDD